jgi:hypothetical protein
MFLTVLELLTASVVDSATVLIVKLRNALTVPWDGWVQHVMTLVSMGTLWTTYVIATHVTQVMDASWNVLVGVLA